MSATRRLALLLLAGLAAAAPVRAQPGGRAERALPAPPVLPGQPGPQVAPVPVPVDTVTAAVGLLAGDPALRSLDVRPDTVRFGEVAWILVDGAVGATSVADTLRLPDWLVPEPGAPDPPAEVERGAGRLAVPVRVYGVAPFRVAAGGRTSGVVTVLSRGTDGSLTAPVRAPRPLGWNALAVALTALALAALLLLARRLWNRRRGPRQRPGDRPVPGAAWPRAAVALERLLAGLRHPDDGRSFLDGLAAVTRSYVADRFGIAGREMTGREIGAACTRLGHDPRVGRAFGRLVDDLDARRFDPEPVGEGWCRDRAAELVAAIAAVRIEAQPPAVPADDLAAGTAAWARLTAAPATDGGEAA